MLRLLQKIKVLYGKIHVTRISYERRGMRPNHDWNVFLVMSSVILLVITFFAFYFYTQVNQGNLFIVAENNSGKEVKINNSLLQKIVDEIKSREKSLQSIKQNKIPPDPSL